MRIEEKYIPVIEACLGKINDEMCRLYWNKYQTEYYSPFFNTGNSYRNDTFQVRAYYWGSNENMITWPNFSYKDMEVHWYKHFGRGMTVKKNGELTLDFLAEMVEDCIASLRRDYGEDED